MYQDTERKVQGSGVKTTMLDASKVLGFGSGKKTKYFSMIKVLIATFSERKTYFQNQFSLKPPPLSGIAHISTVRWTAIIKITPGSRDNFSAINHSKQ